MWRNLTISNLKKMFNCWGRLNVVLIELMNISKDLDLLKSSNEAEVIYLLCIFRLMGSLLKILRMKYSSIWDDCPWFDVLFFGHELEARLSWSFQMSKDICKGNTKNISRKITKALLIHGIKRRDLTNMMEVKKIDERKCRCMIGCLMY